MLNIRNLLDPTYWIAVVPVIFISLTVHEWAHALTAYRYGDKTAKYAGRMTLNPIAHLDPIGTVCLLFFGFGWAKPVPVNPNNFTDRRRGEIMVSLAGPLSNLVLAFIALIVIYLIPNRGDLLYLFLAVTVNLNVGLAVFNLLPVPPLDGSHFILPFLPYRAYMFFVQNEMYIYMAMLLLLVSGALTTVLVYLREAIIYIMKLILSLILGGGLNGGSYL